MKNIKVKSEFYVDDFSSSNLNGVISRITTFINENKSKFSSINFDKENNQFIVSFQNENDLVDILKNVNKNDLIEKKLNRQIRLNTYFDRNSKSLKISFDNIEKFNKYNEVIYSIDCSNQNNNDSLFFHESSLVDYTEKNFNSELKNCKYKLVLISYDENETVYDKLTDKQNERNFKKFLYLCIDSKKENDKKLINNEFKSLNINSNIDILKFIETFNNDLYEDGCFDYFNDENTLITSYKFSNFKMVESDFLLPNGNEDDFLNFKNFVSNFIYETFLSNLKAGLEKLW